ncbi:MerC domain-containing protein [Chryseosolibacter indicus]|uniref:MerC family mercury resistance protein n=1 Tax=Chryseosolibacter indicus TaxID=2782351 RepID=A0ABS5VXA4_9BACT|nr:MerC domain-containing protein [Chryseosolibacter indicus]MBT1704626.1 MerC family mercury resistance protein [Chryseosolibacter indicus]
MISRSYLLDKTGMWASALCAIHCMAVPIVVSMSAFTGWAYLHNDSIETAVLMLSGLIAVASLVPSYVKHHRKLLPIIILSFGFILIGVSRLSLDVNEPVFASSGAGLVVIAHFLNIRFCKKSHTS